MNFIFVYKDICSHIQKVQEEGSKGEREWKEEGGEWDGERETEKEKEMEEKEEKKERLTD